MNDLPRLTITGRGMTLEQVLEAMFPDNKLV